MQETLDLAGAERLLLVKRHSRILGHAGDLDVECDLTSPRIAQRDASNET